MAAIRPFCALRYNPELIGDLSRVIAPPYDVIGAEEQERLYQASPFNVVRLILGKQSPSDAEQDNRYTRAARDFADWQADAILRRDPLPAIYLVEHAFADHGAARSRLGFIALLELGESIERTVYRHEATLAAPKEDRTRLLEAVPANLEPIFCVYPDAGGRTQAMLRGLASRAAPTAGVAIHGEQVRLWVVTEPSAIEPIRAALASCSVLIADGHHRFEVAYAHRSRYPSVMAYVVSMEDPGLAVRPIHRVIQHEAAADLQPLRALCRVDRASTLESLMRWLDEPGVQGRFGYSDGQTLCQVAIHPDCLARWLMAPPVPLPVATLDVSLLHGLILPALSPNGSAVRCAYTEDASQAIRSVDLGQGKSAWLLRAISLPQVYALASQGFLLPPKSTYFSPKVPSGLAINPH